LITNRFADDEFAEPGLPGLPGLCCRWFSRPLLRSRRIFGHGRLAGKACHCAGR
jgi:hypothetical protein